MKQVKRDYQSKTQNKFDNRLNKYSQKTKLKHNDEIIRINQERRRKLERENSRTEIVVVNPNDKRKYILLAIVCLCLMLASMFAILKRNVKSEPIEQL